MGLNEKFRNLQANELTDYIGKLANVFCDDNIILVQARESDGDLAVIYHLD